MIAQTEGYVQDVRPLFQKSEELEQAFLDLAGRMTQEAIDGDRVSQVMREQVLPASESLISETGQVSTESGRLLVIHTELEDAWRARDEAWRKALDAWENRDERRMLQALEDRQEARESEERYIFDVNAVLRPYGHQLQRYE